MWFLIAKIWEVKGVDTNPLRQSRWLSLKSLQCRWDVKLREVKAKEPFPFPLFCLLPSEFWVKSDVIQSSGMPTRFCPMGGKSKKIPSTEISAGFSVNYTPWLSVLPRLSQAGLKNHLEAWLHRKQVFVLFCFFKYSWTSYVYENSKYLHVQIPY